jgi:hypothetical protein
MARIGHPRHALAGTEEAIPRRTEDDAADMRQGSGCGQRATQHERRLESDGVQIQRERPGAGFEAAGLPEPSGASGGQPVHTRSTR